MSLHNISPLKRKIDRIRHMRNMLAAEDDMLPATRVGFHRLQEELAAQATASKQRNSDLLQVIEEADLSASDTANVTNMQLYALRAAYLTLVSRTFPSWSASVAEQLKQQNNHQDNHAAQWWQQSCSADGQPAAAAAGNTSCILQASSQQQQQQGYVSSNAAAGSQQWQQQQHYAPQQERLHSSSNCIADSSGQAALTATGMPPELLQQLTNTLMEQSALLQQLVTMQQQQPAYQAAAASTINAPSLHAEAGAIRQTDWQKQQQQLLQQQQLQSGFAAAPAAAQTSSKMPAVVTHSVPTFMAGRSISSSGLVGSLQGNARSASVKAHSSDSASAGLCSGSSSQQTQHDTHQLQSKAACHQSCAATGNNSKMQSYMLQQQQQQQSYCSVDELERSQQQQLAPVPQPVPMPQQDQHKQEGSTCSVTTHRTSRVPKLASTTVASHSSGMHACSSSEGAQRQQLVHQPEHTQRQQQEPGMMPGHLQWPADEGPSGASVKQPYSTGALQLMTQHNCVADQCVAHAEATPYVDGLQSNQEQQRPEQQATAGQHTGVDHQADAAACGCIMHSVAGSAAPAAAVPVVQQQLGPQPAAVPQQQQQTDKGLVQHNSQPADKCGPILLAQQQHAEQKTAQQHGPEHEQQRFKETLQQGQQQHQELRVSSAAAAVCAQQIVGQQLQEDCSNAGAATVAAVTGAALVTPVPAAAAASAAAATSISTDRDVLSKVDHRPISADIRATAEVAAAAAAAGVAARGDAPSSVLALIEGTLTTADSSQSSVVSALPPSELSSDDVSYGDNINSSREVFGRVMPGSMLDSAPVTAAAADAIHSSQPGVVALPLSELGTFGQPVGHTTNGLANVSSRQDAADANAAAHAPDVAAVECSGSVHLPVKAAAAAVGRQPAPAPPAPPLPLHHKAAAPAAAETSLVVGQAKSSSAMQAVAKQQAAAAGPFAAALAAAASKRAAAMASAAQPPSLNTQLATDSGYANTMRKSDTNQARNSSSGSGSSAVVLSSSRGASQQKFGIQNLATSGAAAVISIAAAESGAQAMTNRLNSSSSCELTTTALGPLHKTDTCAPTAAAAAAPAAAGPLMSAHGMLLSPATRLSLGAAGYDAHMSSSGRPSLSSESEIDGRLSLGAVSTGSAAGRLAAALHIPADGVVPGSGRRRSSDNGGGSGAGGGGGGISRMNSVQDSGAGNMGRQNSTGVQRTGSRGADRQQQQQQAVKGPLTANAPKLPLLSLGFGLFKSKQQQQQQQQKDESSSQPPLQPQQQQQQPSESTVYAVNAVSCGSMRRSSSSSGGTSGVRTLACASQQQQRQLVSKVLNTGLTDFDGSDSEGEDAIQTSWGAGRAAAAAAVPAYRTGAGVGAAAALKPHASGRVDQSDEFDF